MQGIKIKAMFRASDPAEAEQPKSETRAAKFISENPKAAGEPAKKYVLTERQKWLKKYFSEYEDELVGECTMAGCHNKIYTDSEYFKDGEGNIFCSPECVLDWYSIVQVP